MASPTFPTMNEPAAIDGRDGLKILSDNTGETHVYYKEPAGRKPA